MLCYGKSDIGKKRSNNQDSFVLERICENTAVFVVCDGMGGAKGGKEASELAIETFLREIRKSIEGLIKDGQCDTSTLDIAQIISDAMYATNTAVYNKSKESAEFSGMGTTLVAALEFDDYLYIVNVGDSRMYICSGGELHQVTHDHSYVQYLVDIGQITLDEAKNNPNRNIIMRAIGIEDEVEADLFKIDMHVYKEFYVLLCSDGLSNYAACDNIRSIICDEIVGKNELSTKVDAMIELANRNGGGDNITAVLLKYGEATNFD
ncbi:MAG: Stp1/IreP family PP2C-type Ser/Thr phosphatase [Clostridia bacterium]|nr:Stp1/IreP family PP2C-type Ser/Thr phosphatase [Clostridia bacterium]